MRDQPEMVGRVAVPEGMVLCYPVLHLQQHVGSMHDSQRRVWACHNGEAPSKAACDTVTPSALARVCVAVTPSALARVCVAVKQSGLRQGVAQKLESCPEHPGNPEWLLCGSASSPLNHCKAQQTIRLVSLAGKIRSGPRAIALRQISGGFCP